MSIVLSSMPHGGSNCNHCGVGQASFLMYSDGTTDIFMDGDNRPHYVFECDNPLCRKRMHVPVGNGWDKEHPLVQFQLGNSDRLTGEKHLIQPGDVRM